MSVPKFRLRLPWRFLAVTAAGALLYFSLGNLIHLPAIFGFSFRFEFALLGMLAVVYGPITGLCVAVLGELLLAAAGGGFWWSVIAASAFVGFGTGVACNGRFRRDGGFSGRVLGLYIIGGLVVHAIAWVVVCPALDLLFYRESLDNLLQRGMAQTIANLLVALVPGSLVTMVLGGLLPFRERYEL